MENTLALFLYAAICFVVAIGLSIKLPRISRWITNQQLYDRVLVCKNWRGDHDLAQDISVVWDDGYCDEGERKELIDGRTD